MEDMKQLFSPLKTANGKAKIWLDDTLVENINSTLVAKTDDERQAGYDKIFKQIN